MEVLVWLKGFKKVVVFVLRGSEMDVKVVMMLKIVKIKWK